MSTTTTTIEQRTREWYERRQQGIGSSDAAAACGLVQQLENGREPFHPYKTARQLWLEKRGLVEPDMPALRLKVGLALEPLIAEEYERRMGIPLKEVGLVVHPEHEWMVASCDRITEDESRIVEIKKTQHHVQGWGDEWSDEIPAIYTFQVQHQMAVLGKDVADVIALFGDNQTRIYSVLRDDILISKIVKAESDFWELVQSGEQPAVDYRHPAILDEIKKRYGTVNAGEQIQLTLRAQQVADNYESFGIQIRELERHRDAAKAELLDAMGLAESGVLPCGDVLRRNMIHRREYVVAASSSVRLTRKKSKENDNG